MTRRLRSRLLTGAVAIGAATVLLAGPAAAHIEPDHEEVPAGEQATVNFTVEHGCEESPTTKLEIKIPEGLTDAAAVEKEGWTGTVADGVITYTGGPLDAHTEDTFGVTFTPPTAGEELRFPIIQTCEDGSIDWIAESEDDDHPAPVVKVGAAGSEPTEGEHHEEGEEGEEHEATTTTVEEAETTTTPTPTESTDAGAKDDADDDEDNNNTLIAGGIIGLLVVIGGGFVLSRRNKGGTA